MTDQSQAAFVSDRERERDQLRRLRRMKSLATGLLVLMTVVFVMALRAEPQYPWLGYLRAFAEAAMIGALADWFAVTALFRHPLGIPIPHTAIVPNRKDEIGRSLARFMERNFLVEKALRPKLDTMDFAGAAGGWLEQKRNARKLGADTAAFLAWALSTVDNQAVQNFVRRNLHLSLQELRVTPFVGRILDLLTADDRHQEIMDAAIRLAGSQLAENRHRIREKIAAESPWWMPKFVDQEIYDKIVGEIESLLERIGRDRSHAARLTFNANVEEFVAALKSDPEVIAKGEAIKEELLAHPSVQSYLAGLWTDLSQYLVRESAKPDSELRARLERGIVRFAEELLSNADMRQQVNQWMRDAVLHVLRNYRGEIGDLIAETVRSWDPALTARRIELQVGKDLQYIRINGTIVGGLAGLAIYATTQLL